MIIDIRRAHQGPARSAPRRLSLEKTRAGRQDVRTGEMAEWLKAHAWKACVRQHRTVGSNPTLSAIHLNSSELAGTANWKTAPRGTLALAHSLPPCASMIERQIDRPMP